MLNPFFIQGTAGEQNLIQDLINEQLKMYGVEVHYMPRSFVHENSVIREVIESSFESAYPIEAYIQNYEGYADNPVLLSKFGIEQTQELTFIISKERWENYIQPLLRDKPDIKLSNRPKEGDLVYLPLGDRLYEIKYVEHEKPFYQLQKNYVYELRCELFRYEDEVIDTGVMEIDDNLLGNEPDGYDYDGNSTMLGATQTIAVSGVGITASAITNIVDGGIQFIKLTNRGGGYADHPIVGISSSPTTGITGIATTRLVDGFRFSNFNTNRSLRSIQSVDLVNSGAGYTEAPGVRFIGGNGRHAVGISSIGDGVVGIITVTNGGSGYVRPPEIIFNGNSIVSAAATAVIGDDGDIIAINITNAGLGYTEVPTVTISDPYMESTGSFIFNEVITGSISGTTARVRKWNYTNVLDVSNISGTFLLGEVLVGSKSGASHKIIFIDTEPTDDGYADNFNIEVEADELLDFSEQNPFGTP